MSINEQFSSCIFYGKGKFDVYLRQKGKVHQDFVKLSMLNEDILHHSLIINVDLSSYTERSLLHGGHANVSHERGSAQD